MAELKNIPLSDIEMIKNYRDVEPISATDPDVLELSASFMKLGILQPVLVRPKEGVADRYQLIFGHRRYVACGVAGLEELPCNIKMVADEDILELQVTENLQRKDVHPMDEAIAFQSLVKEKHYEFEELGARFGKKPEYVAQRMKLLDLTAELRSEFKQNKMLLGHALQLCRLKPEDQKKAKSFNYGDGYGTVDQLRRNIDQHIVRLLSSAPFKRDDDTLLPKAGPCTTCQKRSGCNTLLFADYTQDDRCFDAACFQQKLMAFTIRKVEEILAKKPEIKLFSRGAAPKEIQKLADDSGVKIYDYNTNDLSSWQSAGMVHVKGIWVNGIECGQIEKMYIRGAAVKASDKKAGKEPKRGIEEVNADIAGLKARQQRALELDTNKVQIQIREQLANVKDIKKPGMAHQGALDRGIMVFLLLEKAANWEARKEIRTNLKSLPKELTKDKVRHRPEYFEQLAKIADDDLAYICRVIAIHHFGNSNLQFGIDEGDTAIRIIAEYAGVPIAAIEMAQKEEADKRSGRADKRMEALKKEKKELEKTRPKKKDAASSKKATAKTAAKTGPSKKAKPEPDEEDPEDLAPDFGLQDDPDDWK